MKHNSVNVGEVHAFSRELARRHGINAALSMAFLANQANLSSEPALTKSAWQERLDEYEDRCRKCASPYAHLEERHLLFQFQVQFLAVAGDDSLELAAEKIAAGVIDGDGFGEDGVTRATESSVQKIAEGDVEENRVEVGARAEVGAFAPVGGLIAKRLEAKFEMLQFPGRTRLEIAVGGDVMEVKPPRLGAAHG